VFKISRARTPSDFAAVAALCASEFETIGVGRLLLPVVRGSWSNKAADDMLERLVELDRRKRDAQVQSQLI